MRTSIAITRAADPKAALGYVCPECKEWSPVGHWRETEVGCEACGTHSALECPLCKQDHDTVYVSFEDPDRFLQAEACNAPLDQADELQATKLFLASADQRWKKAKAEADAARSDLARMKAAWLNAVGGRLLWRPDLIAALAETTTDMRIRLDEIDEEASGARLSDMVAEYGPYVATPVEEDA